MYRNSIFYPNTEKEPFLMKSASSKYSLKVVIENNAEEIERYEKSKTQKKPEGDVKFEPTVISVSLHNPEEPADIRSNSFKIPLGHLSIVYISPKAREVDEDGKKLEESQRKCRLNQDTETLDIFNVYTKSACMFECQIKYAIERCHCTPWNYPINKEKYIHSHIKNVKFRH